MDGCIYRTKDGECDLYAEGGKYKAFCDMDGCKGRKLSNADRIRSMTDEELADYFSELYCYPNARREGCRGMANCMDCWLDWLKQEAEGER